MRIGVVAPRQPPTVGGGYSFHTTVLKALNDTAVEHDFLLLDLLGNGSGAEWAGGTLHHVDASARGNADGQPVSKQGTARFAASEQGLDLVWYLDPLAEVLSVPVFATVLDLAHRQHPFFPEVSTRGWTWEAREAHYRSVLPRAARIFSGTPTGKEQIVRAYGVHPDNIVVNPFPVPLLPEPQAPSADAAVLRNYELSPGFIFYPAQFWPHKNHVNLLLALQTLERDHGLAPQLVLTGSDAGSEAYVRACATDLDLTHRVAFLGFVPADELPALYRSAAALVYPSFFGPDNLPPLEAFALGCPVVAGRIEGVEEQLGPDAALYFDPTEPADIARAVAACLGDAGGRAARVEAGRRLAAERSPAAYVRIALQAIDAFAPWRRNWPTANAP